MTKQAARQAVAALCARPWLLAGGSLALGLSLVLWPYTAIAEGVGNLLIQPVRVEQHRGVPPRVSGADVHWEAMANGDWVVSIRLPRGAGRGEVSQAAGDSMLPSLGPGHKVLYAPVPMAQIQVGDLMVYENITGQVLHRVVEIGADAQGWYAWTQGDDNFRHDLFPVRTNEVKGVVLVVIY